MSQSRPGESDHHGEPDPLSAFNAEREAAESPQKPVDPTPPAAAPTADDALPLRMRLDQVERSLERARIEISALKSDRATLVSAVDDIRKRLGRRPEPVAVPHPVQVPPRVGILKALGVALVCLTVGAAAMWSLAPMTMIEAPERAPFDSARESASVPQGRPIESESSVAPTAPAPEAVVATPAVELQTAATVVPAPLRERVERAPPRQGAYVGTLSIDAAPAGEVFINRQLAGRTPMRAENLRAGSHLIWIEREGYRRWTRVVAVAADRVTRVSVELAPLSQ